MEEFLAFIREWKELVGAIIGGVFSLFVALLVAYQARRAEEKTSATLLIGEFLRIQAMVQNAEPSNDKTLSQAERGLVLAEHLCRFRVRLSPLFDASIARVMHYDIYLAATMTLASSFIRDTEPVIERLAEDVAALHRGEQPRRNEATINADIKVVSSSYRLIAEHAKHSARLLQQIVLSFFPTWYKFIHRLNLRAEDKKLRALLNSGTA